MFCKKCHYNNPTCFGPYSMTIFRGHPSFLVRQVKGGKCTKYEGLPLKMVIE
jgi:hypothetical protein